MLFWRRNLHLQILYLLFVLIALAAFSHAEEPTRIALVGDTTQPDLLNLLSVAEVELGQDATLELLERANIDRILAEQSMSLTGVVDSKKIVQAGQAMTVDLFVMVDRVEKSGPVSLIVFDAQTGVRYVHQSITAKPAALPKQVAQAVRSGVSKFRLSEILDSKRESG